MKQTFLQGALIITIASLLSKIIGSLFRIPLQNIAGDEVYGIFSIVYPVYMAVLTLSVAGIPLAISKLISEARLAGNEQQIRDIYVTAAILAMSFGTTLFIGIVLFSNQIASLLGGEFAMLSLIVVSATLLVAPYMAVYRGYFQGYQDMRPTALSQVLEQVVRVFFILLFAYILVRQGFNESVIAGGVMIGSILGALASLVYLRRKFTKSDVKPTTDVRYSIDSFRRWSKTILKISLPICVGALAMALVNFIDSITVPSQLAAIGENVAVQYGYYGRGLALVQIAVVFAQALILPLIPLITGALAAGDHTKTSRITEKAMKFMHLTSWPAAIGLLVLTVPLNIALFGDTMASDTLAIVHVSAVFTSFAVLTTGLLQGMNKQLLSAYIVLGASVLKVILNIFLIREFGLIGVAWSTLVVYVVLTAWNLYVMKKSISFKLFGNGEIRVMLAAVGMGAVVYLPMLLFDVTAWSRGGVLLFVFAMMAVGAVVYGLLLLVFKGVTREELKMIPVVGKRL
ncbi:polysaccharide biosynthesis protein [Paenalkalicoccus suaedae]|uniref:Polysaccharide biosynthesis protein n=1 Tax=Paenalkalicoccus suaedae TaxID=2592382 RepID=A0A859FG87_9BACI|nr:polysaccharide biosynthesis protein [Paenalkalicoccus suaedae]QKS72383.1 polysaccharide biosynthesis protein [Paenalkalicoccus suaedae]